MATVLVVDDEFGVADLIRAILEDESHTVVTAANGKQALNMLPDHPADLIFLDYMMPVMDGAATLARLAGEAAWKAIPVVMMSSLPESIVAQRCSGYVAFLRKPFRIGAVVELVERWTKRASNESEPRT